MAADRAKADDALRRRWLNTIGRSPRQGYRGSPIPEHGLSPPRTSGIDPVDDVDGTGEGFSGPQACAIVGITYRQLDYWVRNDLVAASVSVVKGSGTQRRFSREDLLDLLLFKRLLDAGVSLNRVRTATETVRQSPELPDDAMLVLGGAGPILLRSGEELVELIKAGRGILNIVPLRDVVEDLDNRIAELASRRGARVEQDSPPRSTGRRPVLPNPAPTVAAPE